MLGKAPKQEQQKLAASIDVALEVLPDIVVGDWNKAIQILHSQKA